MNGTLKTMDHTGDTRIQWDSSKKDEVAVARESFEKLRKKGYNAFATKRNGDKAKAITEFDAEMEEILMVPIMVGG